MGALMPWIWTGLVKASTTLPMVFSVVSDVGILFYVARVTAAPMPDPGSSRCGRSE